MCHSGMCEYEWGHLGDCYIEPEIKKRWDEINCCPCQFEWEIRGEKKKYLELVKKFREEVNNNYKEIFKE